MLRRLFAFLLVAFLSLAAVTGVFLCWGYYYITRDLPKLSRIEDYQPSAVSRLLASDGTLIAEFYSERRYPVKLSEVPDTVRKAFLAAEDASFYSHKGVDPLGILRASLKNISKGSASQGGSTITQQVVKNLLLTPERKLERKIKEAYLAYTLEQRFSKDEILEIYLNQIFFGNSAYGVKAAARIYFHKELSEISLAEAAILAGLPQAPSRGSPLTSVEKSKRRQRYVLEQMVKARFITQEQMDAAREEKVKVFPASQQNIFAAPYYSAEVRRIFAEKWKELDLDTDGLEISAAVDLRAEEFAAKALRSGLREVDKRRGWRGPIASLGVDGEAQYGLRYASRVPLQMEEGEPYPALITAKAKDYSAITVLLGSETQTVDLKRSNWFRTFLESNGSKHPTKLEETFKIGDVIEIAQTLSEPGSPKLDFKLDQTPDIEGSVVLIDPHSGEVRAMIGGYAYSHSQFNRVTQSLRQPGSAFKPVVYLSAIDKFHYTPATIVRDEPRTFRIGDTFWTPANFDETFLGPITLRTALEKSRNLVSADIVSRIGVDAPIEYARMLGITSPLGKNLSLSLGSSEVTLLELTRAYGVLATKGLLVPSVLITRIKDRTGKTIFDAHEELSERAEQVLRPSSAFILTHMMRGVIEHGTGYKVKELGRPVAGKTGTSNDQMDAWFVGFTPSWACGVWVGFDQKKQIGPKETGGVVSAPIWLNFMRDFLAVKEKEDKERLENEAHVEADRLGIEYVEPNLTAQSEFTPPEGVTPYWIYKSSGLKAESASPGTILEYFENGTEPNSSAPAAGTESSGDEASSYLESEL